MLYYFCFGAFDYRIFWLEDTNRPQRCCEYNRASAFVAHRSTFGAKNWGHVF